MKHETILNRPDGKRVKIIVNVSMGLGAGKIPYKTSVEWAEKGKRTWKNVTNTDDHDYKRLSSEDQGKSDFKNQLSLVTETELYDAKLEAWKKIKPKH